MLGKDPTFLNIFQESMMMRPSLEFLPKVMSECHFTQAFSSSPDAERRLHTLDFQRAFLLHLDRTKEFPKDISLLSSPFQREKSFISNIVLMDCVSNKNWLF